MKKFVNQVLDPKWFALCYLPFLAVNMVQLINPMTVTRVFLVFFALWGVAVAAKCYFTGKQIWVKKYLPILLCFLAVCLATEVLNFRYGGIRVLGQWCFFAICILLLYTQNTADAEGYAGLLKKVSVALGVVISVMMIVSLWMCVTMYTQDVTIRSGQVLTIGFTKNRLFGVFSSPNVGGLFATILVWCSIITLYLRKDKKETYPVWIAVSVVQILLAFGYISMALSYGTYLLGFAFVVVFCLLRPAISAEGKLRVWQRYAVRLLSAVVAVALCAGLISVSHALLLKMMENHYEKTAQSIAVQSATTQTEEPTEKTTKKTTEPTTEKATKRATEPTTEKATKKATEPTAEKATKKATEPTTEKTTKKTSKKTTEPTTAPTAPDRGEILETAKQGFDGRVEAQKEDRDISNKRFDIWKNHIEIMTGKKILTGVNDPWEYFQKNYEQGMKFTKAQRTYIKWAKGNMHNGYLQIFVNCGIFALALMLIFLLICFVKCLGMFFRGVKQNLQANHLTYTLFALSAPMVVCILVDNLVETNFVLMGANFFQAIFWFAAGICVFCVTQTRKEKE